MSCPTEKVKPIHSNFHSLIRASLRYNKHRLLYYYINLIYVFKFIVTE